MPILVPSMGSAHTHMHMRMCTVQVSLAWMPILVPSMGNSSAIRAVRALRPLRSLKRVQGMPVLVGSILKSLPGAHTMHAFAYVHALDALAETCALRVLQVAACAGERCRADVVHLCSLRHTRLQSLQGGAPSTPHTHT